MRKLVLSAAVIGIGLTWFYSRSIPSETPLTRPPATASVSMKEILRAASRDLPIAEGGNAH